MSDIYFLAVVVDRRDQSVLIATDIKNSKPPNFINRSEYPLEFGKGDEVGFSQDSVPNG